jgi:hypothetical protein
LAKIPPTNIEEFKAFKNLFENRAEAYIFETNNQNVKNIKNTLSFRINKKSSYTNNIQKRHAAVLRFQSMGRMRSAKHQTNKIRSRKLAKKEEQKLKEAEQERLKEEKQRLKEAKQRLERAYEQEMMERAAKQEKEKTERILTQRRDAAALRLQSMGRMRSAKHTTNKIRSRQQKKRKEIEERLRQKASFENRVTRSMERRREAQRIGHERQMKREENERQRAQADENEARVKLYEGRKINNPEVRQKVMFQEVEKALAGPPQRSPSVRRQTMQRSPPSSATASIIYVRPNSNGRIVNTPGFNANRRNNKRQIVIRPQEETWANTIRRYRNDAYYMFAPAPFRS